MGIVRPVMEVHPQSWLFFVPFILITAFAVMNLVVGLIVSTMQDAHAEEENAATGITVTTCWRVWSGSSGP